MKKPTTITIGIAEDQPLLREGLIASINADKLLTILFDVGNGNDLIEQLKKNRPAILLLDIEMPGPKTPQILEIIKSKYPKIAVIIISIHFDKKHIVECFKLGVKAFLKKADEKERVLEAIHSVHTNGYYSDVDVTKILAEELKASTSQPAQPLTLTKAELSVATLISKGLTRAEVAEQLGVSTRTVGFHMDNIMDKTGIRSATKLATYLIKNQIISAD